MQNHAMYSAHSDEDEIHIQPTVSLRSALRSSPNNSRTANQNDSTMQRDNLFPDILSSPRDRINTLESEFTSDSSVENNSSPGVSKKMLIKLMKEQVNLVRNLTNAQIANKKELEQMKAEKERLETEAKQRDAALATANQTGNTVGGEVADQQRLKQLYQNSNGVTNSRTKLHLPEHVQRDTSDSRSVSSKSIIHRFRGHRQQMYPRAHPDAKYYTNRSRAFSSETYGESTIPNSGVSMASTILPTQIIMGQDNHPGHVQQQQQQQEYNRDKIEITPIPERNVVPSPKKTCFSSFWWFFSHFVTLFIPNGLLCCIGRHAKYSKGMNESQKLEVRKAKNEAKQAWREKVGIFVVMLLSSCAFIGIAGVIPVLLCRETTVFVSNYVDSTLWFATNSL